MNIFELSDPLFLPHCGCELQIPINVGSCVVLTGENGIGKSTLLRHFSHQISLETRVVVEQKASEYFFDRKLITLKQFFLSADLPHFNKEIFLSLWNQFELHVKEQRLISHLSGGESQALKLCLALCKECAFYFLDEPFHYLDKNRRKILITYLEQLRVSGHALLIVEHNLEGFPAGWKVQPLVIQDNILKQGDEWII
ncbi:MAG: ATP-binding cassette domain-containing protein [Bdellovibrionales bacterium]|nr:ATP-binding cassette domain-containing protein [Bdellovibrionales bacterium]